MVPPPVIQTFSAVFLVLALRIAFCSFVICFLCPSVLIYIFFLSLYLVAYVYVNITPVETGTNRYKSVQVVPFCTGLYRPVCFDKFKDFKGCRKFKWAGPFPKITILFNISRITGISGF